MRITLASASPRRHELLRSAGLEVFVRPTDIDEAVHPLEPPIAYTRRLALSKLSALPLRPDEFPALAADTTVWFREDAPPLGKPADADEARHMLLRLTREGPHLVTTAVALVRAPKSAPTVFDVTTKVFMREAPTREIDALVADGEWHDKAGGYAVQGRAAGLVLRLEGSYTNVVGLPLAEVLEQLGA